MRKRALLLLGGAAAIAYSNRKEIGHAFVGTLARTEEKVREVTNTLWNLGRRGDDHTAPAAEGAEGAADQPDEDVVDAL